MRRQFFHLAAILMALLRKIARLGVATAKHSRNRRRLPPPSQALHLPVVMAEQALCRQMRQAFFLSPRRTSNFPPLIQRWL